MNRAPINAFAMNGPLMVYSSGIASASFGAFGAGTVWRLASGTAGIELLGGLDPEIFQGVMGEGAAGIAVDGALYGAIQFHPLMSPAEILLDSSLLGNVRVRPELLGEIRIQGEIISGIAPKVDGAGIGGIEFNADLEGRIDRVTDGEGLALLRLDAGLFGKVSRSHLPKLEASLWVSSGGSANLRHNSAYGHSVIAIGATGSGHLGGKAQGSGQANLSIGALVRSEKWHHVHGSGSAKLSIKTEIWSFRIPGEYEPASPRCIFRVPKDHVHFVVPKEKSRSVVCA